MVFCQVIVSGITMVKGEGIKTKFNVLERNDEGLFQERNAEISIFSQSGRALGAGSSRSLTDDEWLHAHIYVLKNCDEVQPFLNEYTQDHDNNATKMSIDEWDTSFIAWFKNKVADMHTQGQDARTDSLISLSRGPLRYSTCYNGYIVNGFRFRIEDRDLGCKTQNSGVSVLGDVGSGRDYIEYYGVLLEILELHYLGGKRVSLFRCRWFDVHNSEKGAKVDEFGFTSINTQRILKTSEHFILANQASQVFYVVDNKIKGWHLVIKTHPRDLYKMSHQEEVENINEDHLGETYQHGESFSFKCQEAPTLNVDNQGVWGRNDVEPVIVEPSTKRKRKKT
ncbi:unnamed protein product [Cuscuta campestris]|uniref:DUF4216 domain-containing protein n=1 Tax=Cuscuta campestris TaxID=132261 RepID=A0A484NP52_9ASTE|nr:unnamed protein product [Cuscuta campestris]